MRPRSMVPTANFDPGTPGGRRANFPVIFTKATRRLALHLYMHAGNVPGTAARPTQTLAARTQRGARTLEEVDRRVEDVFVEANDEELEKVVTLDGKSDEFSALHARTNAAW